MGMSNGIGTIAGLICPIVIDNMTHSARKEDWPPVFILGACVHFAGVIFYGLFASGELQPWAEPPPEEGGVAPLPGPPQGPPQGKAWDPMEGAAAPPPRPSVPPPTYTQAVADPSQPLAQSTNPFAYGAVNQSAPTNPFSSSALNAAWDTAPSQDFANNLVSQPVQPEYGDPYLHGSVQDRAY